MVTLSEIHCQVERITFCNEENGFTIAKVKVKGEKELVTVVGALPGVNPGEVLEVLGEWGNHPKFGSQFKAVKFKSVMPATAAGIEKYLGSGLIKGIGPIMAGRLVKHFKETTLDIIESHPERLEEVEGIGKKRVQMIKTAWDAQKEIREVMIFLQGQGVSSTYAAKIFKQYGQGAIKVVQENPYRLAADIFGIGFKTADKIAGNLGIDKNSEVRAEAGILYVLQELADEGHVYYPYEPLIEKSKQILEVENEIIVKGLAQLFQEKRIVLEDLNDSKTDFVPNNKAVYLSGYHLAEKSIAQNLRALLGTPSNLRRIEEDKAVDWVQKRLAIQLSEKQMWGVKVAVTKKVMVLTGGPGTGTGKTTIIKAILEIFRRLTNRIVMGAPTGRAAKRMSETTGWEAKTLHRVLEWSPKEMGFKKDQDHPLDADVVIVDEASMIDNLLMYHFLKAVPKSAVLILVGDVNQLPSVGAGNVLKDIISSGAVPVVELQEIFRQALGSLIITNAHRINRGEFPQIPAKGELRDFYFIQKETPEEIAATILELVTQKIPARFQKDPVDDIQVLTPMHRGAIGGENLNKILQEALNKSPIVLTRGTRTYKPGDKVMQIKNDYDREVFNGDIGRILEIDFEEQKVTVGFDGRSVNYDFSDLNELVPAYAVSIHKSQGSEYPVVVIPLHTSHYVLLQRNLI